MKKTEWRLSEPGATETQEWEGEEKVWGRGEMGRREESDKKRERERAVVQRRMRRRNKELREEKGRWKR